VKGIIVPFRASKSAHAYSTIWTKEGSPLIAISKGQQKGLQKIREEPVEVAMRYGNPSPKEGFDKLMKAAPELKEVIAVPLYPHYAMASYETAVEYAKKIHKKYKYPFKLTFVKAFYDDEDYINALAERMKPFLEKP